MYNLKCIKQKPLWITSLIISFLGICNLAYADVSLGQAALNITGSMSDLAKLMTSGAFVMGFGFSMGAILKFKAHKDNPNQVPIGTPIALVFIAASLIFLPALFAMTGQTVFGGQTETGTASGVDTFN